MIQRISDFGAGLAIFLEREAGYHVFSFVLIAVGVVLVDASQRGQVGHDLVAFGTGVLARSMGGAKKTADGKAE